MDSDRILKEMMEKKVWAVVGVTAKKERFGYKIWKILQRHGYEVYGVNPNYDEIEGQKIYKSLKNLPKKVDVIDMVVSPKIGMDVLDRIKEAGIGYVFFQPGTYNEEIIKKADKLELEYLIDDCVYATLRNKE